MTLLQILQSVGVLLENKATAPDAGSDEWNAQVNLVNRAQSDWAETLDWRALYKVYNVIQASLASTASVGLPEDFRKPTGYLTIESWRYREDRPQEVVYNLDSDRYWSLVGNPADGYTAVINPAVASGTSISMPYIATPTSLVTTTSVSPIPDPNYLVWSTYARILDNNNDPRAVDAGVRADNILRRMVEAETTLSESNSANRARTPEERTYRFRLGRD